MSRWLEKQEKLIQEHAESLGVPVAGSESRVSFTKTKYKPGDFHTWKRGDSLFDIAQEMRVPLEQLKAYNEIESYMELEDGMKIYYPVPSQDKSRKIVVELFPGKQPMHVSKPGGAKKWAFGSMTTWDDAKPSGFYPENTNVDIYARARVPLIDKEDPEAEAAYCLDYAAVGDYERTGRLRYTVGYAWSDLEEGHISALLPVKAEEPQAEQEEQEEAPEAPQQPIQPRVPKFLDGFDPDFIDMRLEDFKRDGSMHKFTDTYQKLDPIIPCIAELRADTPGVEIDPASGQKFVWIRDFAMKRPNRRLFHNQEVDIAATFEYHDELYGRPVESIESKNFFGIPMAVLQSQDELYNEDVDATTRQQLGSRLTWSEQYLWIPVNKWLSRFAPGYLKKIKKQNNRKG